MDTKNKFMRITTRNLLSFCAGEFIIGLMYAIAFVAPVELIFCISGLFAEYNVLSVLIVSAIISGLKLCHCMNSITIDIIEDDDEDE